MNNLPLNQEPPHIMHIDLNSCFAIIEQQANRLLRGKPVGVAAYDTPRGFVIASSYEAKAKGVKLGVNVEQARALAPGIVILTPDPAKYREAHRRFKELLLEYTPDVVPKSIDEFVLDMHGSPALEARIQELRLSFQLSTIKPQASESERLLHNEAMKMIGLEMKKKIAESLGEWVTVNVGIGPNRFLAKYAAGFNKPDGLTLIDYTNVHAYYGKSILVDLPGINTRYRARLWIAGIFTPLDFLNAELSVLRKQVFKSIVGYYWYLRLRGHEIDAVQFARKSIGHQFALSDKTTDLAKLERLLMKLCEKTGRRLRKNNLYAGGIHLYLGFVSEVDYFQALHGYEAHGDGEKRSKPYSEYGARASQPTTQRFDPSDARTSGFAGSTYDAVHGMKRWHHGEKVYYRLYSTSDIYEAAKRLLYQAEIPNKVKIMSVHVFDLHDWEPEQLTIFDIEKPVDKNPKRRLQTVAFDIRSVGARKRVSDAVDAVNNRYGEFVVTPATMMDMKGEILDRIAFGQVRDL